MYDIGAPMPLVDDNEFVGLGSPNGKKKEIPQHIFDSAADDLADKQFRSDAMASALTWLEEGDFTLDSLSALVSGMADVDEDDEISEADEGYFDDLMTMTADALVELGGNSSNVQQFIEGDDSAGEKLGDHLRGKMDDVKQSDDELVGNYAVAESLILDSTQKVVRGGRVVLKKKPRRKKKLSSAQKQALKKARRKANTSAARKKRAKSNKVRKSRGM